MSVMIDHDISHFQIAISRLESEPQDQRFREEVNLTGALLCFSTGSAAHLYEIGVLSNCGLTCKPRARVIIEAFERAIIILASQNDSDYRNTVSRFAEIKRFLESALPLVATDT